MPRLRLSRSHVVRTLSPAAVVLAVLTPAASSSRGRAGAADRWDAAPTPTAVVGFRSRADLAHALRLHPGVVLRTLPALGIAEVLPRTPTRNFAQAIGALDGIDYVEPPVTRSGDSEPALQATSPDSPGRSLEWQYAAVHLDAVPDRVKRAASAFTIAVIDTGADLTAPDIGAKGPATYSVVTGGREVPDAVGHGTFVAALAAGSDTNGEGMAGFGGSAKLMVVQASRSLTAFTDVDEAAAIVWAVDHGARILNLSLGGPDTSTTERAAVAYAARHGALVVAAIGNGHDQSNAVEYPAALLQPVGSDGRGGTGLSVGASDGNGGRASFSDSGSHLSLVAPGERVLAAVSSTAPDGGFVKVTVPGAASGLYALGSGTSFAAPEVAGIAALVWATNPRLSAEQVAHILKQTAANHGSWNPDTGYGVVDAAAAVQAAGRTARARTPSAVPVVGSIALKLSTARGRAPLELTVQAALSSAGRAAPDRALTLEAFDGGVWRSSGTATTGPAGHASWRFSLAAGLYRIRARFAGDATIRAAVSRTVSVTVR
jgi:subtilisin family serine protease